MNVLFINFRTNGSSALLRTKSALEENGVMVKSFTYRSLVKEDNPIRISKINRLLFFLMFLSDFFITKFIYDKKGMFFSRNSSYFSSYLARKYRDLFNNFDILHLHWVGHGFISTDFLLKLKLKKIVITFHDYYFLTGGCHVPIECEKYISECRNCPAGSNFNDFQLNNFNEKKELFQRVKVFAIAPSQIMAFKIRNSELGKFIYQVAVVPNPIDTNLYKPINLIDYKRDIDERLPDNKKVVLMVANDLSDRNKGLDLLVEALSTIKELENFCLVTVGSKMPTYSVELGFEIIHLGLLNEASDLIDIYNRSYMTVVPSRFESFSQVTLESLSCGTPVVAFDSSGPSEILTNSVNGFLVKDFSVIELGKKIESLLLDPVQRKLFSENGRKMVENKYSLMAVGDLLKSEYNSILKFKC